MKYNNNFAKYYDLLFPLSDKKKQILDRFSEGKQSILDFGCATGAAVKYLEDKSKTVLGIDINPAMKEHGLTDSIQILDGKDVDRLEGTFDGIYSLGNVLPSFNEEECVMVLKKIYDQLKPGGELMLEILNYNRILSQQIGKLPDIVLDKGDIVFNRELLIDPNNEYIHFYTSLRVVPNYYHGHAILYPVLPNQLKGYLEKTGFEIISECGTEVNSQFDPNLSVHYRIIGRKPN